jgi:hypothetical protein
MSNLQMRRATIEDLPRLTPLWQQEKLNAPDLEKRFKEFQVAVSGQDEVLGAIGLKISGGEGYLHSEAFAHPEQGDFLRAKLWERVKTVAQNFGLFRVWTQLDAPFWRQSELQSAPPELRVPADFGGGTGKWLFVQLKEEASAQINVDKEFALFLESEKQATEKLFRQAKMLKTIAAVVGIVVFILVIVWVFAFMKASRLRKDRGDGRTGEAYRIAYRVD